MERDTFDTELFIDEIEKREAIWDMQSTNYANRRIKRRNWEEIVEVFCAPDESKDNKKALVIILQKKWKGLRDCFVREIRRQKNMSPSSRNYGKPKYIHFERLKFLQRSGWTLASESLVNDAAEEQDFLSDDEEIMRPPGSQAKKKLKLSQADEEFLSIINKNLASRNQQPPQTLNHPMPEPIQTLTYPMPEPDDDKLFCLSLHKELSKIPEENRLQTKIELMKVLQTQQAMHQNYNT